MASRIICGRLVSANVNQFLNNFGKNVTSVCGYASGSSDNQITHTGQKFEDDDYRLSRFVDRPKEVNPNWGIDLIAQTPPTPIDAHIVACDGGGGPLGHPKVYINLDKPGNHSCGYCGLRFFKDGHH